jgi:hypothetical protein
MHLWKTHSLFFNISHLVHKQIFQEF